MSEKHTPTEWQLKIYDFVKNGSGNGIIDAVAGSGKTTTLMNCVDYLPNMGDVVYCAFNISIRKELQKKFKKAGKNVKVCTINQLGFHMLLSTGTFTVDDKKYVDIVKDPEFFESLIPEIDNILGFHGHPHVAELRELEERRDSLDWAEKNALNEGQQYVRKITNRLLAINHKYRCTLADDTKKAYDEMIRHYSIIEPWEIAEPSYDNEVDNYMRIHQKLIKEGNSMAISHGIIDLTDQLYLPHALNLTAKKKYGFVFVDECQDLSKAQLNVVKQYVRADGRVLAVGDPYQSIYGFTGADCNSFQRVSETFNCTSLGLTDCFRCHMGAIRLAQSIRPDIQGFKKDEEGIVENLQQRFVPQKVRPGDLIICRTRKPLREMALKLIMKDLKVKIHPEELDEFMGDYKVIFTPKEMRQKLSEDTVDEFFTQIENKNTRRIVKENQNTDSIIRKILISEQVADMQEVLYFVKKKFLDWHLNTIDSIMTQLKKVLSSPDDDAIKISTIHRAKGLENNRVFILDYNKLPYKREQEWEQIQERNLHYVAVTRPIHELYLCEEHQYTEGDEDATEDEPKTVTPTDSSKPAEIAKKQGTEDIKNEENPDPLGINDLTCSHDANDFSTIPPTSAIQYLIIKFHPIKKVTNIPTKFYAFGDVEDTPYPSLNGRICQKAKYWSIVNNLQGSVFEVINVISAQYQDSYVIDTPNGTEIFNGYYNNSGKFDFRPKLDYPDSQEIITLLSDESSLNIQFEYHPDSFGFEAIHNFMMSICAEHKACITNIFEEQYAINYYMRTPNSYAYIKVMYNGKKIITQIMPNSTLGEEDEVLNSILESLNSIWQK